MKKVLYTLLLAVLLISTQLVSAAPEPGTKNASTTVSAKPESAFEIVKASSEYYKVKNSWGVLLITLPNGQTLEPFNVINGSTFSTSGWAPGTYSATITNNEGSQQTTFVVD